MTNRILTSISGSASLTALLVPGVSLRKVSPRALAVKVATDSGEG
jgi:hypothetical protein